MKSRYPKLRMKITSGPLYSHRSMTPFLPTTDLSLRLRPSLPIISIETPQMGTPSIPLPFVAVPNSTIPSPILQTYRRPNFHPWTQNSHPDLFPLPPPLSHPRTQNLKTSRVRRSLPTTGVVVHHRHPHQPASTRSFAIQNAAFPEGGLH